MKKYLLLYVFVPILLICTCVSAPGREESQYDQWHYTYTILLDPERPSDSPQFDIALSLLYMKYPADKAEYLSELLYSTGNFDVYKDRIIDEQRKKYRSSLFDTAAQPVGKDLASYNWRYAEAVNIKSSGRQGIVIERDYDVYSGGAHGMSTKRYYVLDMDEHKQLKITDFFPDYQGEKRLRDIIYFELGKYSKLESGQKLSQGIFFSDEPELSFNFFVSNKGLGLHWAPYQIAPYAHGSIEIIVPWQVIRPLLLNEGIELLTKFGIYLFV
ncbi:MAG: RsiV family protein [Treponema sp.]|nr:RsiV family protein [Treponema sp.]